MAIGTGDGYGQFTTVVRRRSESKRAVSQCAGDVADRCRDQVQGVSGARAVCMADALALLLLLGVRLDFVPDTFELDKY